MVTSQANAPFYMQNSAKILKNSKNKPVDINSIAEEIISDIPVILTKLIIEFYVRNSIKLPVEADDIRTINNRIFITQYRFSQDTSVLLIKGFIRKDIYFCPSSNSNTSKPNNNLRYYKVDIPFECTTSVNLNKASVSNNRSINNNPFCELRSSKIAEHCKYIYQDNKNNSLSPHVIKKIIELDDNMCVQLELEILQNHHVSIKPNYADNKTYTLSSQDSKLDSTYEQKDTSEYNDSEQNNNSFNTNNYNSKTYELLIIVLGFFILYNLNIISIPWKSYY